MKRILGLDLGTTSIGWALVNEAENNNEASSIVRLGVRVNPLTADEKSDFEKGKAITTNALRQLNHGARINLQRYKLRRQNLHDCLQKQGWLGTEAMYEEGKASTFETYKLRAKAAEEEISLHEFARVLFMLNKKRGYKSNRKANNKEDGQLFDGMTIAKKLYEEHLTPAEYSLQLLNKGKKFTQGYYRSDLNAELERIWGEQKKYYPEILTDEFKQQLEGKTKTNTSKIFLAKYGIYSADLKGLDRKLQPLKWRVEALKQQVDKEVLAFVVSDLKGQIANTSGLLGAISDRSKELYFNKQTVGQYLWASLEENPHISIKNKPFYRQDYLDEFEKIWETQAAFHKQLTPELKQEIRDIIIFYQRPLKSKKSLISVCELEQRKVKATIDGKEKEITIGPKVAPKSSPVFQEFRIWQNLNNVLLIDNDTNEKRPLDEDERSLLYEELSIKAKLSKTEALKILNKKGKQWDLNYKELEGNRTQAILFDCYNRIITLTGHEECDFKKIKASEIRHYVSTIFKNLGFSTEILDFDPSLKKHELEKQPMYQLWHLLYSYESDNSRTGNEALLRKLETTFGFPEEYATVLCDVVFEEDYGNLSVKAMRNILPYLQAGNDYSQACAYAGYNHSRHSLTKEELDKKVYKERLELLPKNSLRNPVVEKILNQMINVINAIIDEYGKPDEIRIEMARELKSSAAERENRTRSISQGNAENQRIREILEKEFALSYISRNDIIKYKLYEELKPNGFKTLYSDTYIPKDKLFSKDFDIEHIIPKARLFDDSFSNKTLEARDINLAKSSKTAFDFIKEKYGEEGAKIYKERLNILLKDSVINEAKYNKLLMTEADIPSGFIERDLRNTQYIAKKACEVLGELVRTVTPTTGKITNRLREDWQLVDVMKELNFEKYEKLGLTEIVEDRDGRKIKRIKDWTKRNDHRHHAMDALAIAFTKPSYIQYLNNLNARSNKGDSIYAIENKELHYEEGKLRFNAPIPVNVFRAEAKRHLSAILVSIKAKNKVMTQNVNKIKTKHGILKKIQLTPRGPLHNETIYGTKMRPIIKMVKVGASLDEATINKVSSPAIREALLKRLNEYSGNAKKAFTGKNILEKNPIYLNAERTKTVPALVKTVEWESFHPTRKLIDKDLNVDKVVDKGIRNILKARLEEFNGDAKKAFSNLEENPIYLDQTKKIALKRVSIEGVLSAIPLHTLKNQAGKPITGKDGKPVLGNYVQTSNNHHIAFYYDEDGNLQDNAVSFFEAAERKSQGISVIDKDYNRDKGWRFLFTMKQNEYFVFPNEATGFIPSEVDLTDEANYGIISPNLYRVQKMSRIEKGTSVSRDYWFRHHLETILNDDSRLKNSAFKRINSLKPLEGIIKVRINSIGKIVAVGEYD
ncbi:type II CRISPR RNA-guided endonuclease Cas9 [Prevotella nigrescens]|uniref:type II CRISPR RNA-guided endonuclease Cas9 n=1 Tax=Prevotella nigrescens TaxID=28133 RepID=UPI003C75AF69